MSPATNGQSLGRRANSGDDKERILKLITEEEHWNKQDESEDPGVDYAAEYKKQTGKDLATGEFVTQ